MFAALDTAILHFSSYFSIGTPQRRGRNIWQTRPGRAQPHIHSFHWQRALFGVSVYEAFLNSPFTFRVSLMLGIANIVL